VYNNSREKWFNQVKSYVIGDPVIKHRIALVDRTVLVLGLARTIAHLEAIAEGTVETAFVGQAVWSFVVDSLENQYYYKAYTLMTVKHTDFLSL
jgi:hypothetical protein